MHVQQVIQEVQLHNENRWAILNFSEWRGVWIPLSVLADIIKQTKHQMRAPFQAVKDHRLLSLLQHFSQSDCSEPRDRIYALYGICSDVKDLAVDYGQSEVEVFMKAAKIYATEREVEWLLWCSCLWRTLYSGYETPSWVPDWRLQPPIVGFKTLNINAEAEWLRRMIIFQIQPPPREGSDLFTIKNDMFASRVNVTSEQHLVMKGRICWPCNHDLHPAESQQYFQGRVDSDPPPLDCLYCCWYARSRPGRIHLMHMMEGAHELPGGAWNLKVPTTAMRKLAGHWAFCCFEGMRSVFTMTVETSGLDSVEGRVMTCFLDPNFDRGWNLEKVVSGGPAWFGKLLRGLSETDVHFT